jgi:hypothetical protein
MAEQSMKKSKRSAAQKGNGKTRPKALELTEKQRRALELRKAGVTLARIAQELGYKDASGAYRAICTALDRTLREPADAVRDLELERLDKMLFSLELRLIDGDVQAIDRALKIMDRRAKYLGLDAPQGVALGGGVTLEVVWSDSNGNGAGGDGD